MHRILTISLALASLTLLADCGRRHVDTQSQQSAPSNGAGPAAPQQQSSSGGGGLFSSSCPALPEKGAVEKGLKDAMYQIYGPDEAQAKFAVASMTPTSDCKTATVKYKGSGTMSSTTIVYDEKWYVMLFNKRYPIQ